MKIVLSPNPYRDKGLKAAQTAERVLRQAGVETSMCFPFELEKENVEVPAHLEFLPEEEAFRGADLMVCFGGDGTILHAAKDAQKSLFCFLTHNTFSFSVFDHNLLIDCQCIKRISDKVTFFIGRNYKNFHRNLCILGLLSNT